MDLAGIEQELAGIVRGASTDAEPAARACKLNLVVACADGSDLTEVSRLVARISESEPGRALLIGPGREVGGEGLEVHVSAHCYRGAGGSRVCCEQVTLQASEAGLELVPGTVLGLLVGDVPVYTWWRRRRLAREPLLGPLRDLSDRLIVSSAAFEQPIRGLKQLLAVATEDAWRGHPADLTWARLDPWREAIASFFDQPALRAHLERSVTVSIRGGGPTENGLTAAGAYMAGWLSSRLGWTPVKARHWRRRDGGDVRIELTHDSSLAAGEVGAARIESSSGALRTAFVAERVGPGSPFVRLTVEMEGTCPLPRTIKLPARDEAALLCGTLQTTAREPIFEAALVDATQLG